MKLFFFSSLFLLTSYSSIAQVGVGTTAPASTLDVTAVNPTGTGTTVDGILIPRVTRERAQSMTGTTTSTLIYVSEVATGSALGTTINVTSVGFYFYDGTVWQKLASGTSTDWSLIGNAGTAPATNFLGTTDDVDLVFRRNAIRGGFIGNPTYDGSFDFINGNTSFGANSLLNPTLNFATQSGVRNTAIGVNVMPGLTSGRLNTGIGEFALFSNTTGNANTALGSGSLYSNSIGFNNVAIGRQALTSSNSNNNTAVGFSSLRNNVAGTGNSALGYRTLSSSTGSNNTAIGFDAGTALTTGSNNIMIGANTVAPVVTGSDQLNIGNTIFGSMAGVLTAGVNTSRTIGINVTAPQGALDITSTTDGVLIPRVALTATNVATVLTPTVSELVYNSATSAVGPNQVSPGYYYWDGSLWIRLATGNPNTDWGVLGNSGLSGTTNFLGTTDDVDVAFRRNNLAAGKIGATSTSFGLASANLNTAAGTTAFGVNALAVNVAAIGNTAVGSSALAANTAGTANTAVGSSALAANTTSVNNTAVGFGSLAAQTTAGNNTAIGTNALTSANGGGGSNTAIGSLAADAITTGSFNVAVGSGSLGAQTTSQFNVGVGANALLNNVSGANNVAVGTSALNTNTASDNTAVGHVALFANTTGTRNTAIGLSALGANTTATGNTAVGASALAANTTAPGNTAVGSSALAANTATNNTAVGASALAANTTSLNNVAVGYNALLTNTTGVGNNTAVGSEALLTSNGGVENTAIGRNALRSSVTSASFNTAVGSNSLRFINDAAAQNNVAVGYNAMENSAGNVNQNVAIGSLASRNNRGNNCTSIGFRALGCDNGASTGVDNVAVGQQSMRLNTSGQQNVAIGSFSLQNNGSGSFNTAVGFLSGNGNSIGSNNTYLGMQAGSASSGSFNTFIGHQAGNISSGNSVAIGNLAGSTDNTSNKLYISNSATTASTSLIYGEFSPARILRTNSTFQIGDPAGTGYVFPVARGTVGQVLQTDAAGVLTWQSAASVETDPQVSSATNNRIPKWNGTTLVDGIVTDDGTTVTVAGKTSTTNFQMPTGASANFILQSDATGNGTWVQNPLNTLSMVRTNLGGTNQVLTAPFPPGSWEKINFPNEVFDTSSEFTGGTFTATKAGFYQINAGFHTNDQSNTQQYAIGVFVNGTLYQETSGNHTNIGEVCRNINCIVNLAVGNTVEIHVKNFIAGVQINGFVGKTFFEVQQIR
ncbi:beta strand repeat-containing protein [Flavobacterium sp.]|jgi:hypothetical protein|uniref:beta strand repeat-containing protein n=1 Tax=Flavobacterium sp. TaxID=239 RepID=UPI0037BFCB96